MANDQEKSLVSVEQKTIEFYGDELTAVRVKQEEGSSIYVPVRRLVENLGLDWAGQYQRINRNEILAEAIKSVGVTPTQLTPHARSEQDMLCLPIDLVPGWLFGINANRVKPAIREKLLRYQRECFRVLWDAFKGEILPVIDEETQLSTENTPAEQALAHVEALYNLARQQVAMERWLSNHASRLDTVEDRLDKAAIVVGDYGGRLRRIELTITGGVTVTDAQAAAISEAVKALAFVLGKQEADKGNPYQRVYAELYRKFRVPSYKALPLESFPAVMRWLTEWWQELTEEDPPFAAGDVGGQLEMK